MSIKIDQVPEMTSTFKNISIVKDKPVNLLVDEGRCAGQGHVIVLQAHRGLVPRPPLPWGAGGGGGEEGMEEVEEMEGEMEEKEEESPSICCCASRQGVSRLAESFLQSMVTSRLAGWCSAIWGGCYHW